MKVEDYIRKQLDRYQGANAHKLEHSSRYYAILAVIAGIASVVSAAMLVYAVIYQTFAGFAPNKFLTMFIIFLVLFFFAIAVRSKTKELREIIKRHGGYLHASQSELQQMAQMLEHMKPTSKQELIATYGQRYFDVLALSYMIIKGSQGKYHRLVSLDAIREDREAGPEDE